MSRFPLLSLVTLLILIGIEAPAFAQKADGVSVAVHGNTGSPPLLGASYRFTNNTAVRVSAGFYSDRGHVDVDGTCPAGSGTCSSGAVQESQTRWYAGAIAGLYYLPNVWSFRPYVGVMNQYVYAANVSGGSCSTASADRIDAGAVFGTQLAIFSWLSIHGETTVGYRKGLSRNSGLLWNDFVCDLGAGYSSSDWGINHLGVGIQVHF